MKWRNFWDSVGAVVLMAALVIGLTLLIAMGKR